MPRKTLRTTRMAGSAVACLAKSSYRTADKLATYTFKAMTTDHLGISRQLMNMPKMGFLDTLRFIAMAMVAGLISAIVAGALAFVGIAYVIPAVLGFAFNVFFR